MNTRDSSVKTSLKIKAFAPQAGNSLSYVVVFHTDVVGVGLKSNCYGEVLLATMLTDGRGFFTEGHSFHNAYLPELMECFAAAQKWISENCEKTSDGVVLFTYELLDFAVKNL